MRQRMQGRLTRCIGMEGETCPCTCTRTLKEADRLLLCSDGLTEVIDDEHIAALLSNESDCEAACEALVDDANAAGGYDNITVVIIDWQKGS